MAQLPYNGIEYNKAFYQEVLPSLIEVIKYAPPINQHDDPAQSQSPSMPDELNHEKQISELTKA